MPTQFSLPQRIAGFVHGLHDGPEGQRVSVMYRQVVPPDDAVLVNSRLQYLNQSCFRYIPGFPSPPFVEQLLVVIRADLSGVAYINELAPMVQIRPRDGFQAQLGGPVYGKDIVDIAHLSLGVDVPVDAGYVLLQTFGWRRALAFDFGPLRHPPEPREYNLGAVAAQQLAKLLELEPPVDSHSGSHTSLVAVSGLKFKMDAVDPQAISLLAMEAGLDRLSHLLNIRCQDEATYQELLAAHPWIFGGLYSSITRHTRLDDENIPDFTGVRRHDGFLDIIELKQPFTPCFKNNGDFSQYFNASWQQAERYVAFVRRQHDYLRDEKGLRFENPRCWLLIGHGLTEAQERELREKSGIAQAITVLTYDQLLSMARSEFGRFQKVANEASPAG
jgi:hypothetical protein